MDSPLSLEALKLALRVTHDLDDADLQRRLNSSTDYALRYMNRHELPREGEHAVEDPLSDSGDTSEGEVSPAVEQAIFLHVEIAFYRLAPADADAAQKQVENLLHPYRLHLGV